MEYFIVLSNDKNVTHWRFFFENICQLLDLIEAVVLEGFRDVEDIFERVVSVTPSVTAFVVGDFTLADSLMWPRFALGLVTVDTNGNERSLSVKGSLSLRRLAASSSSGEAVRLRYGRISNHTNPQTYDSLLWMVRLQGRQKLRADGFQTNNSVNTHILAVDTQITAPNSITSNSPTNERD